MPTSSLNLRPNLYLVDMYTYESLGMLAKKNQKCWIQYQNADLDKNQEAGFNQQKDDANQSGGVKTFAAMFEGWTLVLSHNHISDDLVEVVHGQAGGGTSKTTVGQNNRMCL